MCEDIINFKKKKKSITVKTIIKIINKFHICVIYLSNIIYINNRKTLTRYKYFMFKKVNVNSLIIVFNSKLAQIMS